MQQNAFWKKLLANEMEKMSVKMNKTVHQGLPILDVCKIAIYDYCYDYVKPKYGKIAKVCYMDMGSFMSM